MIGNEKIYRTALSLRELVFFLCRSKKVKGTITRSKLIISYPEKCRINIYHIIFNFLYLSFPKDKCFSPE